MNDEKRPTNTELFPEYRNRFRTILADPPWDERGGGRIKRGADRHYPLLKTDEIIEFLRTACPPLRQTNREASSLFLWTTNNFLPDGLRVMDALGYRYVTNLAWAKDRMGLGYYFHGQHELVLFGVRGKIGKPPRVSGYNSTLLGGRLLEHPRDDDGKIRHSEKPRELHEAIEARFEGEYLELFAREARPGWTVWGNEV